MFRTLRAAAILATVAALAGCAGSPVAALRAKPDQLAQYDDITLCQAYHLKHSDKVRTELTARQALDAEAWAAVDAKKIYVGMSSVALTCSWGPPDQLNTTATEYGKTHQLIYGLIAGHSYVYIENKRVVAFQN